MASWYKIIFLFYCCIFGMLGIVCWIVFVLGQTLGILTIHTVDVGQGDGTIIKTPHNRIVVVDGGRDNTIVYGASKYLPFWERHIDVVVVSHPDSDHYLGLIELARRYRIHTMVIISRTPEDAAYQLLLREAVLYGTNIVYAEDIDGFIVDEAIFEVLHPQQETKSEKDNERSIVLRLVFGELRVLFTGDAGFPSEETLMRTGSVRAAVLKVGHHGSRYSTSERFIGAVAPELALISVGNNTYGHPHPDVLERLHRAGVPYLTTMQAGDITVASDGTWVKLIFD